MAPRIAQRQTRLAGVILLAAPVNFGMDTILRQSRYIGQLNGMTGQELDTKLAPIVAARDAIAHADPAYPPAGMMLSAPMNYWMSLRAYDPVAIAKTLHAPMLILQGDSDYQVTPSDDYAHWEGRICPQPARVQMHDYPRLSHLFMPASARHRDLRTMESPVMWMPRCCAISVHGLSSSQQRPDVSRNVGGNPLQLRQLQFFSGAVIIDHKQAAIALRQRSDITHHLGIEPLHRSSIDGVVDG